MAQTNAGVSDERLREIERPWLLVKRGFYWRPEGMGYTAFKAEAGRYTDADAAMIVDEPGEGTSRIRYDDAEEFSPACPDDAKVRMLMVERSRLRTELLTRRSVTSQASEGAEPEGWKLVPTRSTDAMHTAYTKAKYEGPKPTKISDLYAAMLAAAPASPVSKRIERLKAALKLARPAVYSEPTMVRICPERDGRCPHGIDCPFAIDRGSCDMIASRAALRSTPC